MIDRCYQDLRRLCTFEERYRYLRLCGVVGAEKFGFDRHLIKRFTDLIRGGWQLGKKSYYETMAAI